MNVVIFASASTSVRCWPLLDLGSVAKISTLFLPGKDFGKYEAKVYDEQSGAEENTLDRKHKNGEHHHAEDA